MLPKEIWEGNIARVLVWSQRRPTEGPAALQDNTDYKVFGRTEGSPSPPAAGRRGGHSRQQRGCGSDNDGRLMVLAAVAMLHRRGSQPRG